MVQNDGPQADLLAGQLEGHIGNRLAASDLFCKPDKHQRLVGPTSKMAVSELNCETPEIT